MLQRFYADLLIGQYALTAIYSSRMIHSMARLQLYIPAKLHHQPRQISQDKGQPMAHVTRTFLQEGIERAQETDYTSIRTLEAIANLGISGGPKDLSVNLDHYLYGRPKKKE